MPLDSTTLRAPIATRMREIFGKDGEGWCKGTRGSGFAPAHCLFSAAFHAKDIEARRTVAALNRAGVLCGIHRLGPGIKWNDAPERTFADISRVVDEIERMELAGEVR